MDYIPLALQAPVAAFYEGAEIWVEKGLGIRD